MSIFKTLKFTDIEIGNIQSVDEMTIVPILGAERGDVASPTNLVFQSTSNYGTMVFENLDQDKDAIVPSNMMIRGRSAQDHAMSGSGVVMKNTKRSFNNACCIEETQGGYLQSTGNEEDVLPVLLRRSLLDPAVRSNESYSKLWGKIKLWLEGVAIKNRGRAQAHLRYFYDTPEIKEALEEFAAEFEPVDGQIGAIIMFSGVPVGIEIMPSVDHWETYWKHLIRGCYGAEMVRLKMIGKLKPSALILPEIPKNANPTEVKELLDKFSQHLRDEIVPLLDKIDIKTQQVLSADGSMQTTLLRTTSGGGGDLIEQDNQPVYLSLVL